MKLSRLFRSATLTLVAGLLTASMAYAATPGMLPGASSVGSR